MILGAQVKPFSKSAAADLYDDSISLVQNADSNDARVLFEPLIGIAPVIYPAIFSKTKQKKRKDALGVVMRWKSQSALPVLNIYEPTYLQMETKVLAAVYKSLTEIGVEYQS